MLLYVFFSVCVELFYQLCKVDARYILYVVVHQSTSFKELDIFFATYQTQKKLFRLLIQQKLIIIYPIAHIRQTACYKTDVHYILGQVQKNEKI